MAGRKLRPHVCENCGATFETRNARPRFCGKSCAATWQHAQSEKITLACERCQTPFTIYPSESARRTRRFCSEACYRAWRTEQSPREERHCAQCGKPFVVLLSWLTAQGEQNPERWQFGRFCSIACVNASHVGVRRQAQRECVRCGGTFYPLPGRPDQRFCSRRCVFAYRAEHVIRVHYYGPDWPTQKQLARERDNHTCQNCGKQQQRPALDVHHMVRRGAFGSDYETANALENLITLCRRCHRIWETRS